MLEAQNEINVQNVAGTRRKLGPNHHILHKIHNILIKKELNVVCMIVSLLGLNVPSTPYG